MTKRLTDQKGSKNPNWKGGISKNHYHYKLIQKQRFPDRIKARLDAYIAVRRGKIEKGVCEICGIGDVQIHHDDYSKPFDIRWLCPQHHRQI